MTRWLALFVRTAPWGYGYRLSAGTTAERWGPYFGNSLSLM